MHDDRAEGIRFDWISIYTQKGWAATRGYQSVAKGIVGRPMTGSRQVMSKE
jgi:hypothetical protein